MQLTPLHYAQAWYEALQEAKPEQQEQISQAMLRRLQREGKLNLLGQIIDAIKDLEAKKSNKAFVTATTAHAIDEKELVALAKDLFEVEEVELTVQSDKSLLGGVVLETKNTRWDLSTKNQLEQLKSSLKN